MKACSRLYRSRFLQVNSNTRVKALGEIYKMYTRPFALVESKRKTMKSASGKRPPDEAHGPGKEAIRPQQRGLGK